MRHVGHLPRAFLHFTSLAVIFEDISSTKPRFSLEGTVTSH